MKTWKAWRYILQLARYRPWQYASIFALRSIIFCVLAQAIGLDFKAVFDTLTGNVHIGLGLGTLIILVVALPLLRVVLLIIDSVVTVAFQFSVGTLLRKNLLESILDHPGARAIPGSSGEAITRFRDDVDLVANFMNQFVYTFSFGLFALTAIVIMFRINIQITLLAFLPMIGVIVASNLRTKNIIKYRQISRIATGNVTSFIGEMFGAVQAIKVAAAEESVLTQFERVNEVRRKTDLKEQLLLAPLRAFLLNTANLSTGIILLASIPLLKSGSFTIGDITLFVYYIEFIGLFTARAGTLITQYKQVNVSLDRLIALLQGVPAQSLVRNSQIWLQGPLPDVPSSSRSESHRLNKLTVTELSYHYPGSSNGIENISLDIERGSFTVITGRIGSGKTTLLRVILGLLPKDAGEIYWNGIALTDPATFFVPPFSAYTAQVPRLFSDTVRDNILLGLEEEHINLQEAMRMAIMEEDVGQLERGLETIIGPRGVKLSGGQIQRTAAARMFVRDAELLVFDDVSSALDVETEQLLWRRIFERKSSTYLVVSHRRAALGRADRIIVLKHGRVIAQGALSQLLVECEEMRYLWESELAEKGTDVEQEQPPLIP